MPISRPPNAGGKAVGAPMREVFLEYTANEKNRNRGRLGLAVMLWVLLVCLLPGTALAIQRGTPVRIGVLTASWGPPPGVTGLIEGLVALGYRENEDFVIGVRFTRGDSAVLPAVAREMVRDGVTSSFAPGSQRRRQHSRLRPPTRSSLAP